MTHSSQDRTVLGTLYLLASARAVPRYRNPRRRQAGAHLTDSRLTPLRIITSTTTSATAHPRSPASSWR